MASQGHHNAALAIPMWAQIVPMTPKWPHVEPKWLQLGSGVLQLALSRKLFTQYSSKTTIFLLGWGDLSLNRRHVGSKARLCLPFKNVGVLAGLGHPLVFTQGPQKLNMSISKSKKMKYIAQTSSWSFKTIDLHCPIWTLGASKL